MNPVLHRMMALTCGLGAANAASRSWTYSYNALGHLAQVKDPRGVTTRYGYDGLGNLTQLLSPDSGTTTYVHEKNRGSTMVLPTSCHSEADELE